MAIVAENKKKYKIEEIITSDIMQFYSYKIKIILLY